MCLLQHMPMFQHTAARRRLGDFIRSSIAFSRSFNTQPPEGGWSISTLSATSSISFNTQPPEGGWVRWWRKSALIGCFNTQPPEGGWIVGVKKFNGQIVSTHSRPKAAGYSHCFRPYYLSVSTHSRPKAAGMVCIGFPQSCDVSTHSRPKAAGL